MWGMGMGLGALWRYGIMAHAHKEHLNAVMACKAAIGTADRMAATFNDHLYLLHVSGHSGRLFSLLPCFRAFKVAIQ